MFLGQADGEFPNYQEKVTSCQRAYQLLRSKLDFPPEDPQCSGLPALMRLHRLCCTAEAQDIIFDCLVTPLGAFLIQASNPVLLWELMEAEVPMASELPRRTSSMLWQK